jgi:LemA protein
MKKYRTLLIGLGIVLVLIIMYISSHNGLVAAEEQVNGSWGQVQNQYQRRLDLIPNLVETVKGYASHESGVLTEVTELRSRIGGMNVSKEILDDPEAFKKFQDSQSQLSSAISRLLVVSENYPDLKANQNFLALQSQLEGTENRISVERKRFNDAVQTYNTKIRRIPASIVASLGGFRQKAYFQSEQGAENAPKVKF